MELRIISLYELKDLTGPCLCDILLECFRKNKAKTFSFQKSKEELGWFLYKSLLTNDKLTYQQKRNIDNEYSMYLGIQDVYISELRNKWLINIPEYQDEQVALRLSKSFL
jgi:hypothetical protein